MSDGPTMEIVEGVDLLYLPPRSPDEPAVIIERPVADALAANEDVREYFATITEVDGWRLADAHSAPMPPVDDVVAASRRMTNRRLGR